jgi:hypothetical protein
MTVSWGNAERSGERAGIRPATVAAPGAAPGDGPGRPFPGETRARTASGRSRREHMTKRPDHGDARRIAAFLESHPGWSAFWDKQDGVWRVAEDDPTSELHAESADADEVLDYMATHSQQDVRHDRGE